MNSGPDVPPAKRRLRQLFGSLRARRWTFWVYAAAIFILTHWPRLEVPSIGIERTDILVHMLVFGTWTTLLLGTLYLGPARRARTILKTGAVALAYAAFDESTQALPFVQRHAALDDYAANALGIVAACIIAALVATFTRRRRPTTPPPSAPPPP